MPPGIKPIWRQAYLPGCQIFREVRIQRLFQCFRRVFPFQVKCYDLPAGMHTGIRPTCDLDMSSLPTQASESLFYF